ncbi:MAG: zinc ribbon domain-containing protein [Dehalococcoidia bacterium]
MPIYEYRCTGCRTKQSIFFRSVSTVSDPVCPNCGSTDLKRLVSLFAVHRSEEGRLDDLSDPSGFGDLDENDPRSVARWARKMGAEMGEELGPEFDEMVDRMEAGEMPDDLGDDGAGGFGGMGGMGGMDDGFGGGFGDD